MLSEEEKKAIDKMNKFVRVHQDMSVVSAKDMDIVLKLVEKLQKEIENLKYKCIKKLEVKNLMEKLNKEIKNCDTIEAVFKIKQQQILQELLESSDINE